jgi:hypothetical protein
MKTVTTTKQNASHYCEAYGQGYWVIRPVHGATSRTEHSALYTSLGAASAARGRGEFEIRIWGDEAPPVIT